MSLFYTKLFMLKRKQISYLLFQLSQKAFFYWCLLSCNKEPPPTARLSAFTGAQHPEGLGRHQETQTHKCLKKPQVDIHKPNMCQCNLEAHGAVSTVSNDSSPPGCFIVTVNYSSPQITPSSFLSLFSPLLPLSPLILEDSWISGRDGNKMQIYSHFFSV